MSGINLKVGYSPQLCGVQTSLHHISFSKEVVARRKNPSMVWSWMSPCLPWGPTATINVGRGRTPVLGCDRKSLTFAMLECLYLA
uniref:Uncharacterized protein n=1 Tax=Pyxicephalus adspersus TaxID=30357 RepID=A0AAV3AFG0_PYXAD|nr:TPA: hypothetical protein GDO54_014647 [Pyxicephalus adspersus]